MGISWKTFGNTIPLVNIVLNLTKKNEDTTEITFDINSTISSILLSIFAIVIQISQNTEKIFTFNTFIAFIFAPYYLVYILIKIKFFEKRDLTFTL